MQDLNFLQDFKFDHLDQLEPEVCTLCEEFCTSGNLCQSCPCWWWRFDDGDDGEDVDDEGYHDDDDLEDENYFGDDISVLSVNNCNSSNSRDLVQRLDQLGVAHHLVPE